MPREKVFDNFLSFSQLALMSIASSDTFFNPTAAVSLKSTPLFNYKFNIRQLGEDIKRWRLNGYKVGVSLRRPCARSKACRGVGRGGLSGNRFFKRAGRAWRKHGYSRAPCERLCKPLQQNRPCRRRRRISQARRTKRRKLAKKRDKVFLSLEKGDYAVHEVHGIGLCDGVHTLTGSFGTKDFIKLLFRDGEAVYVPVENTDMLSKYGGGESAPRLSRLGGAEFEKVKMQSQKQS